MDFSEWHFNFVINNEYGLPIPEDMAVGLLEKIIDMVEKSELIIGGGCRPASDKEKPRIRRFVPDDVKPNVKFLADRHKTMIVREK